MDVFGYGTDEPSRPLLPPGTCWVCDNSPQQEAIKVIDTRRNSRAGGALSHESVRKYICESCARELGQAVGMVPPEQYQALAVVNRDLTEHLDTYRTELEAARASQTRVISLDEAREMLALPALPDVPPPVK